jgi:hypothetical protein
VRSINNQKKKAAEDEDDNDDTPRSIRCTRFERYLKGKVFNTKDPIGNELRTSSMGIMARRATSVNAGGGQPSLRSVWEVRAPRQDDEGSTFPKRRDLFLLFSSE